MHEVFAFRHIEAIDLTACQCSIQDGVNACVGPWGLRRLEHLAVDPSVSGLSSAILVDPAEHLHGLPIATRGGRDRVRSPVSTLFDAQQPSLVAPGGRPPDGDRSTVPDSRSSRSNWSCVPSPESVVTTTRRSPARLPDVHRPRAGIHRLVPSSGRMARCPTPPRP